MFTAPYCQWKPSNLFWGLLQAGVTQGLNLKQNLGQIERGFWPAKKWAIFRARTSLIVATICIRNSQWHGIAQLKRSHSNLLTQELEPLGHCPKPLTLVSTNMVRFIYALLYSPFNQAQPPTKLANQVFWAPRTFLICLLPCSPQALGSLLLCLVLETAAWGCWTSPKSNQGMA